MPIGVICNVLSVVAGGLFGAVFSRRLHAEIKEKLNLIFGLSSMGSAFLRSSSCRICPLSSLL